MSPHNKIRTIKFRGSCRSVDWASTPNPLCTESWVRVFSESAAEINLPRVLVNHYTKAEGTLHLLVYAVIQLAIRLISLRCPSLRAYCNFCHNIQLNRNTALLLEVTGILVYTDWDDMACLREYMYAPHNGVSVNDRRHILPWSHDIIIL